MEDDIRQQREAQDARNAAIDAARRCQDAKGRQSWDKLIASIHATNEQLSECQHRRTVRIVTPADEDRDIALDEGEEMRCRDCWALLSVEARR